MEKIFFPVKLNHWSQLKSCQKNGFTSYRTIKKPFWTILFYTKKNRNNTEKAYSGPGRLQRILFLRTKDAQGFYRNPSKTEKFVKILIHSEKFGKNTKCFLACPKHAKGKDFSASFPLRQEPR